MRDLFNRYAKRFSFNKKKNINRNKINVYRGERKGGRSEKSR